MNALDADMTLSVRELVEFVLKAGDIDSRFQPRSSMLTGTRLHQKLQRRYEEPDEKEVHLKGRKVVDGISYQIEGRCDGIIHREGKIMVEEIKSTARSLDDLEEGMGVHWAQAECYASLLTEERGWDAIHVRLTYIHTGTEETKSFTREYDREELQGIMIGLLQLYTPFAEVRLRNEENLEASLSRLSFPFETFRKGQRQLVGAVYKTVTERKTLFANAPTGTGKTISTLFPVVKEGGRWFYATAKTISRTVAEDAVKLMEEGGLSTRALTITAKDKICFKDQTICQPDHCEFACGHYDRVNGAILDILQKETLMTRPVIEEYAKAHRVCPFEFSIDLSYLVEGVIGDYNYLFDPRTSLKRFSDSSKKQTTLLIDEAHNLVPRGGTCTLLP
ncbi:PD-(D/E)XK nuclease family protein [Rossellomorea marisflavi]|uniref:PD-(D/E)XK nuclease family protein n=1 Tax=Rossellomorea marisflavi TaxID=189381 RepID=UPI00203BC9B6|nr:PD-(D/E)XK nuclease family protein [Rossellomorea marisflavi]